MENIEQRISFIRCDQSHKELVTKWWRKPHVVEYWDNSPEMWNDFSDFLQGKSGLFEYWVGSYDDAPFCLGRVIN